MATGVSGLRWGRKSSGRSHQPAISVLETHLHHLQRLALALMSLFDYKKEMWNAWYLQRQTSGSSDVPHPGIVWSWRGEQLSKRLSHLPLSLFLLKNLIFKLPARKARSLIVSTVKQCCPDAGLLHLGKMTALQELDIAAEEDLDVEDLVQNLRQLIIQHSLARVTVFYRLVDKIPNEAKLMPCTWVSESLLRGGWWRSKKACLHERLCSSYESDMSWHHKTSAVNASAWGLDALPNRFLLARALTMRFICNELHQLKGYYKYCCGRQSGHQHLPSLNASHMEGLP